MVGLKTMREISWIAILGTLATTITVVMICILSVLGGNSSVEHVWVDANYPYAFTGFVFAFGGHNVFPAIQNEMRSKIHFEKMLNWSFLLIALLYIPPCIFGYLYFGMHTQRSILDSLSGDVSQLVTVAITIHVWLTLPIINNPLNLWLENSLQVDDKKSAILWRTILRTINLILQLIVACTVPRFEDFMALIVATTVSATMFFCPCLFYLKLYWPKIPWWEVTWICFILLFATMASVIQLYSVVVQLYIGLSGKLFSPAMWFFWTILGCVTYIGVVGFGMGIWHISNYHQNLSEVYNTITRSTAVTLNVNRAE